MVQSWKKGEYTSKTIKNDWKSIKKQKSGKEGTEAEDKREFEVEVVMKGGSE